MKNVVFVSLLVGFVMGDLAFAQEVCTPTKSVTAALAEYKANISALDAWLRSANNATTVEYEVSTTSELANYNAKLLAARVQFDKEIAEANRDLNWRENVDTITARYNAATAKALNNYKSVVDQAKVNYDTRTAEVMAYYDLEAKNFATSYKQAVCAR